eukprot:9498544-Pyramimonas_sp.AAC.1
MGCLHSCSEVFTHDSVVSSSRVGARLTPDPASTNRPRPNTLTTGAVNIQSQHSRNTVAAQSQYRATTLKAGRGTPWGGHILRGQHTVAVQSQSQSQYSRSSRSTEPRPSRREEARLGEALG